MVRDAAVKRKTESPASDSLPFDGQRRISPKTAASDYQLPSVDLLNEAEMRREQADDELLNMATKLAEKCREFNVTGQIEDFRAQLKILSVDVVTIQPPGM